MELLGGLMQFLFQALTLALIAGGIADQLGRLLTRATTALNLPYLHSLAVSADNWLFVIAVAVWALSVVSMAHRAYANRTLDLTKDQDQGMSVFAPIMMFLMYSLFAAFIVGAGLLAAALAHVFLDESAAIVVGLLLVALIVGWLAGVTHGSPVRARSSK